jgi:hypothetical protein
MGAGESQPGNWTYQLLSFIEESASRGVGQGFKCTDASSKTALGQMIGTSIATFYCPSRRAPQSYPMGSRSNPNFDMPVPPLAGKTDYAANMGGDFAFVGMITDEGPRTLEAADTYAWKCSGDRFMIPWKARYPSFNGLTGVIFQRSEIRLSQITDGTSHTYLLGEKNIDPNHYDDGNAMNDDQSMYNGHDRDNVRAAFSWYPNYEHKGKPICPAEPDTPGIEYTWNFGGPHPAGWVALFCDSSVRFLTYNMNPDTHQNFGSRADGNVIDRTDL